MKKVFKRVVSTALAVSMLFSSAVTRTVLAAEIPTAGGWYETLFAELNVDESKVTAVSYTGTTSGTTSGSLSGNDLTYLVRANGSGKTRIDIPGVPAGTYTLNVTANGTNYTKSGITVYANDRSGYAHKDAKSAGVNGVGAYNDDGSLKSNAVVVYVTESNKNTVKIENCSAITNSPVGIGNILNYKSEDSNGTSKGGKDDVLQKLANADIPLVVRVIGTVYAGDSNTRDESVTNIIGLTAYNSTTNGGTVKDNGMIARMFNAQNVTVEGIGTDAVIDGWGFQVISGTDRAAHSVEFRNLTFRTTPEDAIGLEGTVSKSKTPQSKDWLESNGSPIKFCWVHNCTFEHGYCKNPAESDKAEGDGSLDFKRGYGFTQDYNHYIENHKTNLIGSSSDSIQYDVTYHHNYYDQVWSRQPLIRQANAHIYNSYFKNGSGTSYIISPRAYSYTLSEANFYDGCKNPIDSPTEGTGYVKSYKDTFSGCFGNNYATIVDDRTQAISGNTNPYKNDFDGSLPYTYVSTDAVQAKADCIAKAGIMKAANEINMNPSKISTLSEYPSGYITLPYTLDLSDTYAAGKTVVGNAILNAASKSSGGS
ncbi:MAG: polysaccharide lyase, partial [Firmicutes bacterium]|nr:polysaccharide lyase [Bacillota bacterium]